MQYYNLERKGKRYKELMKQYDRFNFFDMYTGNFLFYYFLWYKARVCGGRNDLLKRLNSMRGIFAIEIVIGHVIRYENTILYPLGKFMIISVAFSFSFLLLEW